MLSPSVLICLVVAITDGDTLRARCSSGDERIRIAFIDAPEKRQAWGQRAKQSLEELCRGVTAEVREVDRDRYGRLVATVSCRGVSVSEWQIEQGMAWVYRKYTDSPSLLEKEYEARRKKIGLWSEVNPIPPWEWRKQRGK